MSKYQYTWRPGLKDNRDYEAPRNKLILPGEVDLVDQDFKWLDPFDQLNIGTCTANADSFCGWYYFASKGLLLPEGFSRLFLYARERDMEGSPLTQDTGAIGHDGFKIFRKTGVPLEKDFPYIDHGGDWQTEPPESLNYPASQYKIPFYRHPRLTKRALQTALARKFPVSYGITVYESFENPETMESGYVPTPNGREKILGGHQMVFVGYDSKYVKSRNSWGTGVGDRGYFYLPWEYVEESAEDFRYFCDA